MRRTELPDAEVPPEVKVVLLDTLGELRDAMSGASAAFIGGTFNPEVGGHSPWEARVAGVPVDTRLASSTAAALARLFRSRTPARL